MQRKPWEFNHNAPELEDKRGDPLCAAVLPRYLPFQLIPTKPLLTHLPHEVAHPKGLLISPPPKAGWAKKPFSTPSWHGSCTQRVPPGWLCFGKRSLRSICYGCNQPTFNGEPKTQEQDGVKWLNGQRRQVCPTSHPRGPPRGNQNSSR